MEKLTPKERVQAIFAGEPVDILPWFADLQWWRAGLHAQGRLPRQFEGVEGLLRLHRQLSTGIYLDGFYMCAASPDPSGFSESVERQGNFRIRTIHTPEGDLRMVSKPATDSWAVVHYPVRTVQDMKAVRAYYEALHYSLNADEYLRRLSLYNGWGLPMPLVQRTPIMEMIITWCGIENFTYLEYDYPREVSETLTVMGCSQDKLYDLLALSPSPYLEIGDNISGEVVGGYFRKYGFEYYRRRADQIHAAGKKLGTHIDGTLGPVLRTVAETGVDFVEGITPSPVGDLSPEEIREELSGYDTIVWGGVPAALFAEPDWNVLRQYISGAARTLWRDGKLILGVGDQVPPNGEIDYCRRIARLMEELGPPTQW